MAASRQVRGILFVYSNGFIWASSGIHIDLSLIQDPFILIRQHFFFHCDNLTKRQVVLLFNGNEWQSFLSGFTRVTFATSCLFISIKSTRKRISFFQGVTYFISEITHIKRQKTKQIKTTRARFVSLASESIPLAKNRSLLYCIVLSIVKGNDC